MQFEKIIGQNELKQRLIQTVNEKRISHAQLFLGTEGSGNLALALAYAQYIACENRSEHDSCGHCKSCNQFQKLIHPDLHFAFPVNTSKSVKKDPISDNFIADWREIVTTSPYFSESDWYEKIGIENKQGNIGKLEAEAIQQKMNYKPYESDYKFMLIWLPERMNTVAANKLLKLIEEPPKNTLFLLVSKNIDQIIKTILSRTQLIKVPPIDESSMRQMLQSNYDLSEHEQQVLLHLASGDVLKAKSVIEQRAQEQEFFENFTNIMRLAYACRFDEMLDWAEEMASIGREQQKNFIVYAEQMIRENFMLNRKMDDIVYIIDDERKFAEQFSKFISPKNVMSLYGALNLALAHIEQNGNQKIIFSDLSITFARLLRKT